MKPLPRPDQMCYNLDQTTSDTSAPREKGDTMKPKRSKTKTKTSTSETDNTTTTANANATTASTDTRAHADAHSIAITDADKLSPALIDRDPIAAALAIMADTGTTYQQAEADLRQINPTMLPKIVKLVCFLMEGDELAIARRKAGVSLILLSYALDCKFFANIYNRTRRARQLQAVADIEAAQNALAAGRTAKDPDRLPPDPTAAKLILQAHDPLYHPGQSAPVTAINIQVNGLPI